MYYYFNMYLDSLNSKYSYRWYITLAYVTNIEINGDSIFNHSCNVILVFCKNYRLKFSKNYGIIIHWTRWQKLNNTLNNILIKITFLILKQITYYIVYNVYNIILILYLLKRYNKIHLRCVSISLCTPMDWIWCYIQSTRPCPPV